MPRTALAEDATAQARQFVEQSAASARAIAPATADSGERRRRFASILGQVFDVAAIGRSALGRYWDGLDDRQRADFIAAFRGYVTKSYADRFFAYAGQPMTILESRPAGEGLTTVHTLVSGTNGGQVPVDWLVADGAHGQRVTDVTVDGVSLGRTQHDEIVSVMRGNGGDVGKLIDLLRQRSN